MNEYLFVPRNNSFGKAFTFFCLGHKAVKESRSEGRECVRHSKVVIRSFRVGSDGKLDLADGSVDLVTSCQAVHWFDDLGAFYAEADRVLRPGGAIAVYGYHFTDPVAQGEGEDERVERFIDHREAKFGNLGTAMI